jgi:hypothetical protein
MTCVPPDDSTEPIDIDDGTQIDQNKKEKKVSFSFSFFALSTQCDHPTPLPMMTMMNPHTSCMYCRSGHAKMGTAWKVSR